MSGNALGEKMRRTRRTSRTSRTSRRTEEDEQEDEEDEQDEQDEEGQEGADADGLSLQDRIDDAIDDSFKDAALMWALLDEAARGGYKHPALESLRNKCSALEDDEGEEDEVDADDYWRGRRSQAIRAAWSP